MPPLIRRIVLLLLPILFLGGCSTRKLAYNLAGRLLLRSVDKVLDLHGGQKDYLRGRLAGLMAWHRQEELPRYADILGRMMGRVAGGTVGQAGPRAEAVALIRDVEAATERLARRLAPDLGPFLATLTPAQIANMERSMTERNRERFEDLDLEEGRYVKARMKQVRKSMERWLGGSTPEQEALLVAYIRRGRSEELRRRDNSLRNQQEMLALLRQGAGPQALEEAVRSWMTSWQVKPDAAYQEAEARSQESFIDLICALERTLSGAQRQHLAGELYALRGDLLELSRER